MTQSNCFEKLIAEVNASLNIFAYFCTLSKDGESSEMLNCYSPHSKYALNTLNIWVFLYE